MSFPTSGFTPSDITYFVTAANIGFHCVINVNVNDVGGQAAAEEVVAILDTALVSVANALEGVTGAGAGVVYKQVNGSTDNTNIA